MHKINESKKKLSKYDIFNAVQKELAEEQMKQFLLKGYADTKHLWTYFMVHRYIKYQDYGRTGPEAYNNITKKKETIQLFINATATNAASKTISAMKGATKEVQEKAEAMNDLVQSWCEMASKHILPQTSIPRITARQIHADLHASMQVMREMRENKVLGDYKSIQFKRKFMEQVLG